MLATMLGEARELAALTEHYYQKNFRRNPDYTIWQVIFPGKENWKCLEQVFLYIIYIFIWFVLRNIEFCDFLRAHSKPVHVHLEFSTIKYWYVRLDLFFPDEVNHNSGGQQNGALRSPDLASMTIRGWGNDASVICEKFPEN